MNSSSQQKGQKLKILSCCVFFIFPLLYFWLFDNRIEHTSGQIPNEVYVWQRQWDSSVADALIETAPDMAGYAVLAAEVSFKQGQIENIVRVPIDYEMLKATEKPVTLALRIGPYSGDFRENPDITNLLCELAGSLIEDARKKAIVPNELQIDFDCAESKLKSYQGLVKILRREVARSQLAASPGLEQPVPIVITVLPSWLKRRAFKALVKETDGFVLQVHSIERPKSLDAKMELCNIASSMKWIEKAARLGVPFRVALPTYGYIAGFDNQGQFLGLAAEGPSKGWPDDASVRVVTSDAVAIAELVQKWLMDRPVNMKGLIWYRLPVKSDQLNWNWETLSMVMSGQKPQEDIKVEISYPQAELAHITLANIGQLDSSLNIDVGIECQQSRILAADGMNGFMFGSNTPKGVSFRYRHEDNLLRIRPGEQLKIGWLRFDGETEVKAYVKKIH